MVPLFHTPIAALPIKRIAIFRALALGDMLCSVPALRALRQAYPSAQITLIGLPWAQAFIARFPNLIDDLMLFPGAVGFPEQAESDAGLPDFYAAARARHFDLALQLHGSGGVANDIVLSMGAQRNAGFFQPNEPQHNPDFMLWPDELPESERYNAMMEHIGLTVQDRQLAFPLTPEDHAGCEALARDADLDFDRLVCIHPGARLPSRRWSPERFALVAAALMQDGWQIVITGSGGEQPIADAVLASIPRSHPATPTIEARSLAGRTSLGVLGALVSRARLLVCNDTGLSHVAAGVRTRSIVIASGSDTRRWAPLDASRHRVFADYPPCRPCSFEVCPYPGHPCANNVSAVDVISAARNTLAQDTARLETSHASPPYLHRRSASHAAVR